MEKLDTCPHCKVSLLDKEIPEASRELYGGATHFRRTIGVQIRGVYDGVLYWMCPDCGGKWNRWPTYHPLHKVAREHINRPVGPDA